MESGFLTAPEYLAHINTDFVQSLYLNILGRTGNALELAGWNDQSQTLGMLGIANNFTAGLENRQDAVTTYFESFLERAPTGAELTSWTNQPGELLTLEAGILGSQEYAING
jgi:hypothetical protein